MMNFEEIRKENEIVNAIDWEMTPEEAVTRYLEWGNNWTHGKNLVRSKKDVSYYFVVNTWDDPPRIYLIKRNSDEAVDLAVIDLPESLKENFMESVCHNKGVYPVNDEIKDWLEQELYRH
jgi:predicted esterase YcpF (UPF0227 family)